MRKLVITACTFALAFTPGALSAQIDVGVQGNWGEDVDFGVGGRVVVGLPVEQFPLQVIGSFDIFFPDVEGLDYWEINGNLVYMVDVPQSPIEPYFGAGLNLAHASAEASAAGITVSASDTELGINLLGGVKFVAAPKIKPYGEVRFELAGGEQIPVITAGVAFNVGPGPGM